MTKHRSALALLGLALSSAGIATFAGCGSDSSAIASNPNADAGGDAAANGIGRFADCHPAGDACATSADCCTGNCNAETKQCGDALGICGAPGAACAANNDCCTFACLGGACSNKQCIADLAACAADNECCGGKCSLGDGGAGTCTPLSTSCKTSGNPCGGNGDCCSGLCANGICSAQASFCTQTGDACSDDHDCCGGSCTKAAGATLGLCAVASASGGGNCTPAGQACGAGTTRGTLPSCGGECCSRSCRPYAPTGLLICQPPSGCHPTGELCEKDTDCCGAEGTPGSTALNGNNKSTDIHCSKAAGASIGRCDNGNVCSPAGSICRLATNSCNATDRCCSGTVQTHPLNCKQDALGIPRCTVESDKDCTTPVAAGTACASGADCCGNPCVPNPSGDPPFVCSADACVAAAGACTTTSDCCAGSPCIIPVGASKGVCGARAGTGGSADGGNGVPPGGTTCAQYGQQCGAAADCCSGVPCTAGRCQYAGPN